MSMEMEVIGASVPVPLNQDGRAMIQFLGVAEVAIERASKLKDIPVLEEIKARAEAYITYQNTKVDKSERVIRKLKRIIVVALHEIALNLPPGPGHGSPGVPHIGRVKMPPEASRAADRAHSRNAALRSLAKMSRAELIEKVERAGETRLWALAYPRSQTRRKGISTISINATIGQRFKSAKKTLSWWIDNFADLSGPASTHVRAAILALDGSEKD